MCACLRFGLLPYNPCTPRNAAMPASSGMRVGEVLKFTPGDANDQKLTIQSTKSYKDVEVVFILRKVVERLRTYMKDRTVELD